MKVEKKYIIYGSLAVVGGVLIYGYMHRKANKAAIKAIYDELGGNESAGQKLSSQQVAQIEATLPDANFPLKIGSVSKQALRAQKALNSKFGSNLALDGRFGDSMAQVLCKHVWTSCYSDYQARNYTLTNAEYSKLIG